MYTCFRSLFEKRIAQNNMHKDNTNKKKVKQQEDKNRIKRQRFDEKRSIKIIEQAFMKFVVLNTMVSNYRNETQL